jgi:glycosyltransferase involved in cell wall biosynthesis
MKKKILILTLNDYIIYQPSVLNLYDFLTPHFDVTVVSFKPEGGSIKNNTTRNIVYLNTNYFLKHFFQKTDFILSVAIKRLKKLFPSAAYNYLYYNKYLPHVLKAGVKSRQLTGDIIIAADFPALHAAQKIYGSVHLISLEIENNTNPIHKKIDRTKVKSVFIQSKERYNYLFPGIQLPTFFVQNAPVFDAANITHYERKDFIWSGAMDRRMAMFDCLNFFDKYPQYKLIIKGSAEKKVLDKITTEYAHLISANRVIIDQTYLPAASFLDFLSHFKFGFAFYSWDIVKESFNYATAPSGKLFMNMAAGVPVIACNIPGFKLIEEFGAGVLIDDFKPETIYAAMNTIEKDYEKFQQGCYKAAAYFSFDKAVAPYINFLLQQTAV